jgi:hypothetical protein
MSRRPTEVRKASSRNSENKLTGLLADGQSEDQQSTKPILADVTKKKSTKDRKRIMITGVNSLVGHSLFEQMRNDHLHIHSGKKPHKFAGSLIQADKDTVPVPSSSIKTLDFKKKPKSFGRAVVRSDTIIVDLLSGGGL